MTATPPDILHVDYPWALFDEKHCRPIDQEKETELNTTYPFLLITNADIKMAARIQGKGKNPEQEGAPFTVKGVRLKFVSLPVSTSEISVEAELSTRHAPTNTPRNRVKVRITNNAPQLVRRTDDEEPAEETIEEVQRLVKALESYEQELLESEGISQRGTQFLLCPWKIIAKTWLTPFDEKKARKELIVDHAERLRRLLRALITSPKKILERLRLRQPVSRIQEFDSACLQWYVRQPGTTTLEKAGPKQELLGISRRETYDTLENRVLKDFLKRSEQEARNYCQTWSRQRHTSRWKTVNAYKFVCQKGSVEGALQKVHSLRELPVPNYVLLHDVNYKKIWKAYLDLLRDKEKTDDLWRWQKRLWAEIARFTLHVGLMEDGSEAFTPIAQSPLLMNREQKRGRFTTEEGQVQSSTFLLKLQDSSNRAFVLSPVDTQSGEYHPLIENWQRSLAPSMTFEIEEVGTGQKATILTWGLHTASRERLDLTESMESCQGALQACLDIQEKETGYRPKAAGLLLLPSILDEEATQVGRHGEITSLQIPIAKRQLDKAVKEVPGLITDIIKELFPL